MEEEIRKRERGRGKHGKEEEEEEEKDEEEEDRLVSEKKVKNRNVMEKRTKIYEGDKGTEGDEKG